MIIFSEFFSNRLTMSGGDRLEDGIFASTRILSTYRMEIVVDIHLFLARAQALLATLIFGALNCILSAINGKTTKKKAFLKYLLLKHL